QFTLKKMLRGHDLPVNTVAVSHDGLTLLTGADDGHVIVWDLETARQIQDISCVFHGQVVCICWIDLGKGDNLAFIIGCADGSLQVYQRVDLKAPFAYCSMTVGHKAFVQNISYDHSSGRIASVGRGTIQLWKLTTGCLEKIPMDFEQEGVMVQSVHFLDNGTNIILCLCELHEVLCYNVDPWNLQWAKQIPTRIGHSMLSSDEQSLFISNLLSGVDQYRLPSMKQTRSYSYPILHNYMMQVSLFDNKVVMGRDDGFARVFDIRTGQLTQMLDHSHGERRAVA
ncbi:WD40 repeat-like protein, partial [Laetiporus sulphureus 93-53]